MRLSPEVASEFAAQWEYLNIYLHVWIVIFTGLIFLGVFAFAVKYRRRSEDERPQAILGSVPLEIAWSGIPFLIAMSMFVWGAALYFDYASPPADAMEIYVTGKQWMFYTQHPEGQREINELHVPIGRPVRLTMSSEDVIHSFFIPAFRVKADIIPGRYTSLWFTATKPGQYHLFCAEYCGTQHSGMGGWVYVMEPAAYEAWLSGGGMDSMVSQGERLFAQLGCSSCHNLDQQGRCPILRNVYGSQVELTGGGTVTANDAYIRESILNPGAEVVAGFQNIMPSYQGQVSEQNLLQLIAYVKSLSTAAATPATPPAQDARPADDDRTRFRGLTPTQ